MSDGFNAKDAAGASIPILTDQVTDATLGTAQKQLIGVVDATIDGTNKMIVDSSGNAHVSATVTTSPAASRTTDAISAALATDAIMNGTTALAPSFSPISVSTSGSTTLVALVSSKKIRMLGAFFVCSAAQTVKFLSHTTTAQATGAMQFAANGGIAIPFSPTGWFDTVAGEALDINLATNAVSVAGMIVWIAV